jgi:putative tryptophan/tyrosine transport system substrate-binding protein
MTAVALSFHWLRISASEGGMRRREFILSSASAAAASALVWPLAARPQQPGKLWKIGFLSGLARPNSIESSTVGGFPEGMRELGYVEGKDFVIEWRFAEARYERFAEFAAELVRTNIDIFVLGTPVAVGPVKLVTSTIPVVMGFSTDPVGSGFVASLAHPGGNVTGLATSQDDTTPKQLELLALMVPGLARVGILANPASPNALPMMNKLAAAAKAIDLAVVSVEARTLAEIDDALRRLASERVGAFMLVSDSLFNSYRTRIGELALRERLPSMFAQLEYVEAGGLIGYGQDYREFFRRAATYVDKIFNGAEAADLPIEQPTRFALVINLRTAKALGLTPPPTMLALADRVIE